MCGRGPKGTYNGSSAAVNMQKTFAKTPLATRIHCRLGVSFAYDSGACSQASRRLPTRAVEAAASYQRRLRSDAGTAPRGSSRRNGGGPA